MSMHSDLSNTIPAGRSGWHSLVSLLSRAAGALLFGPVLLLPAQVPGDAPTVQLQGPVARSDSQQIMLRYANFDPLVAVPPIPPALRADTDTSLWIVQFHGPATDEDRAAIERAGGKLVIFQPHDAYVVRMSRSAAGTCAVLREVRWVGPYHPAYRLEEFLLREHAAGAEVPVRPYNMVMADKRNDKAVLRQRIEAIGGTVVDEHRASLLFTATLSSAQLLQVARFDEVLWIDRWTESSTDNDNARIVHGPNAVETAGGYTGNGVRGHVYEGVEATHPDFTIAMTNVRSGGTADTHGHCTAGCVFGNGTSAPQARGMAPAAQGFYTNLSTVTAGWSRNMVISDVVNVHQCMFTTASWGAAQTPNYTSISADADDIVFDHRIPWTNSMSNLGNQNVRPEAWAKNVISVGALRHYNNSNVADDLWASWPAGGLSTAASIGPASDGRIKPDLCSFYDDVWTSDRSGAAGYSSGNSTQTFGGTSAATPLTAGLNALAIQMYTDGIFGNPLPAAPTVGNRFVNRPYAQTLKALQIACASLYPVSQATRPQAGWGRADLNTMYTRRNRIVIIPENRPITQGATHTYLINVLTGETSLKVCMTYLDLPGNPASSIHRINDLTLRVISPSGTAYWGNNGLVANNTSTSGGSANTIDTVENVFINNPAAGTWRIEITAPVIAQDAHLATGAIDATYALVVNGGVRLYGSGCARHVPDDTVTGTANFIPFGSSTPTALQTLFASNNQGSVGGAVYFDVTPSTNVHLTGFELNTAATAGQQLVVDVYTRTGTHVGNEGNPAAWTARTAGLGVAAGLNVGSQIDLNQPILLSSGITYGFAIVARNFAHHYTNGTGSNQNYSGSELTVALGSATNVPFSGSPFTPRVANITLQSRADTQDWTNQLYQTILRREDLGSAGTIRGLAFSPTATGRHFNRELVVRMSHVPAGHVMSTTFANNLPSPVTVLNAQNYTWHVTANSWNEIGLTTPFAYNGTSDVVVQILARGNHSTAVGGWNRANNVPRVFAYGLTSGAMPAVATGSDTFGQRIRVNMNCAVGTGYGTSCGTLRAKPFGTPDRGGIAWFDLEAAPPSSLAIIGLGFQPFGIPNSLTSAGFTNCFLWHQVPVTLAYVTSTTGFATHAISVPNDPTLDGTKVSGLWAVFDAGHPGGVAFSNYITNLIGIDP